MQATQRLTVVLFLGNSSKKVAFVSWTTLDRCSHNLCILWRHYGSHLSHPFPHELGICSPLNQMHSPLCGVPSQSLAWLFLRMACISLCCWSKLILCQVCVPFKVIDHLAGKKSWTWCCCHTAKPSFCCANSAFFLPAHSLYAAYGDTLTCLAGREFLQWPHRVPGRTGYLKISDALKNIASFW